MIDSNHSTTSVTLDMHPMFLYDYAIPTMFIVTLMINCVIIYVRKQPNMWGSKVTSSHKSYANNRMLFAIAICHAQTFVFPTLFHLYQHTIGFRNSITLCYGWHIMVVVTPQVYYTVSNILVAVLSVMRYCCQHYPFQVNEWFRTSNVIKMIACSSMLAIVINVPKYFENVFHSDGDGVCEIEFTQWSLHYQNGSLVFAQLSFWTRFVLAEEVVCIVTIVFSILTIRDCNNLKSLESRVSGKSVELKRLRNEFENRSKLVAVAYGSVLILEISLTVVKYRLLDTMYPYSMITSLITFIILCVGPITYAINSYISQEFCHTLKATCTIISKGDEGIALRTSSHELE